MKTDTAKTVFYFTLAGFTLVSGIAAFLFFFARRTELKRVELKSDMEYVDVLMLREQQNIMKEPDSGVAKERLKNLEKRREAKEQAYEQKRY
jgi:hypothetical protein|tara:strand:+ start:544 stop:819 length:276 start_codon:yes stop_codon:yes gene_type:complete